MLPSTRTSPRQGLRPGTPLLSFPAGPLHWQAAAGEGGVKGCHPDACHRASRRLAPVFQCASGPVRDSNCERTPLQCEAARITLVDEMVCTQMPGPKHSGCRTCPVHSSLTGTGVVSPTVNHICGLCARLQQAGRERQQAQGDRRLHDGTHRTQPRILQCEKQRAWY